MHVTLVHVKVTPDRVQDFIDVTRANHQGSIREPDNLRFDVLQSSEDPTVFVLYEAYASPEAAAAHKTTSHYLEWRDAVAGWMASARRGVPYRAICPEKPEMW
jgi:autoinducer 2-degrading protein